MGLSVKEIVIVKVMFILGVIQILEIVCVFQVGQEVIVIKVYKYLYYFLGDLKNIVYIMDKINDCFFLYVFVLLNERLKI